MVRSVTVPVVTRDRFAHPHGHLGARLFDELLVEAGDVYGVAVLTASNEAEAGRPACRCCIQPNGSAEHGLVIAGGADLDTTEGWMISGGWAQWWGDRERIARMLDAAGFQFDVPPDDTVAFRIDVPTQAVELAQRWIDTTSCPSCGTSGTGGELCDGCAPYCESCGTIVEPGDVVCDTCDGNVDD